MGFGYNFLFPSIVFNDVIFWLMRNRVNERNLSSFVSVVSRCRPHLRATSLSFQFSAYFIYFQGSMHNIYVSQDASLVQVACLLTCIIPSTRFFVRWFLIRSMHKKVCLMVRRKKGMWKWYSESVYWDPLYPTELVDTMRRGVPIRRWSPIFISNPTGLYLNI